MAPTLPPSLLPPRGDFSTERGRRCVVRRSRPAAALPQGAWARCCAAAGGLDLLLRCRRGSGPAAALPQGVRACWCAAAGGLDLLLRCRRESGLAGALPRPSLCLVSERASTGRLAAALVWGLGLWVGHGVDPRCCVRALGFEDAAFVTGSRRERRSVRPSASKGRILGALCVGATQDSAFVSPGRHGRRDFRAASPLSVDLQPQNGSCGCRSTDRTRERRTVGQERRNEEPCVEGKLRPDPETRSRPQARCRSRPFRKPTPAPAEAAHQQPQASAGCASANPDPLRQPDRRTQPSWRRAPARRASARTVSRSSPVTVTCPTLRPGFTPLP